MAMTRVEPVQVRVRTGWFDGRPLEVSWGERRLPITELKVVRDEASAYRAESGPRTVFEVETPEARLALSFQHRSRHWTIEGLEERRSAA